jgi:hypothetical protein
MTLTNALKMAAKPLIKVLVAGLTGIKRWNIAGEKLQIFILTGFPFLSIPPSLRAVRRIPHHQKINRHDDY